MKITTRDIKNVPTYSSLPLVYYVLCISRLSTGFLLQIAPQFGHILLRVRSPDTAEPTRLSPRRHFALARLPVRFPFRQRKPSSRWWSRQTTFVTRFHHVHVLIVIREPPMRTKRIQPPLSRLHRFVKFELCRNLRHGRLLSTISCIKPRR